MATRTLSFNYVLKQNKNDESVAFGKYFAEAFGLNSPLSLKGLCNRVAMDQSVFTPEIAKGVIMKLTTDMVELLQSGNSIKWDGLGTFRPTVESNGVVSPADYDVNRDVKGIHVRFIPENERGDSMTSRKFAESLTFAQYGTKNTQAVQTATGKTRYTGEVKPSATTAKMRKLPILTAVGNEKPSGTLPAAGATLRFSGSVEGITYTVMLGETQLGTHEGTGAAWSLNSGAQTAGTSGVLKVAWSQGGEPHEASFGQFSVE